jgi:hypothetical protein
MYYSTTLLSYIHGRGEESFWVTALGLEEYDCISEEPLEAE